MKTIELSNGKIVLRKDYISAKIKDLQDFGYPNLTEKDITEQLEKILKKEELSVVGMFMQDDIKLST